MVRHRTFAACALLLVFLAGAAWQQSRLMRAEISPMAAKPVENAPPIIAFATVALGGLSGMLIDILWARITDLQDQGDYIEIVQLADWITTLEPRLAAVWDFHSFNIAYNISAMCPDPAERWKWVENGISMLRDRALVYNPDYLTLYDRLCRIYKHKLVDRVDPATPYYRLEWAEEMSMFTRDGSVPSGVEAVKRLHSDYRLDTDIMRQIDSRYGPFDWRLPEAHVIYWAYRGQERAGGSSMGFDYMICEMLARAVEEGAIARYQPDLSVLETSSYLALLPKTIGIYKATLEKYGAKPGDQSPLSNLYGHFLRSALLTCYNQRLPAESNMLFLILANDCQDPETKNGIADYVNWIKSHPQAALTAY